MTTYPSQSNKLFLDEERRINEKAFKLAKKYGRISNETIDPLTTAESLNLVEFQALINKVLVYLDPKITEFTIDIAGVTRERINKYGTAGLRFLNLQFLTQSYNKLINSLRKAYNDPTTSTIMRGEMQKLTPYLQVFKDYYYGAISRGRLRDSTDMVEVLEILNHYNIISLMLDNINTNSYNEINTRDLKMNMDNSMSDFGSYKKGLIDVINSNISYWDNYDNILLAKNIEEKAKREKDEIKAEERREREEKRAKSDRKRELADQTLLAKKIAKEVGVPSLQSDIVENIDKGMSEMEKKRMKRQQEALAKKEAPAPKPALVDYQDDNDMYFLQGMGRKNKRTKY